jgi:hypothetical protein
MSFDGRLLSGVTVLAAVVECGSFRRAATVLGMSDSGVGRAVARLETRVGVRLLDRTTRSLALTEEGARFYAEVGPGLADIEEAAEELLSSPESVRGKLRVDVDPFLLRTLLADGLAGFPCGVSRSRTGPSDQAIGGRSGGRWTRCRHTLRRAAGGGVLCIRETDGDKSAYGCLARLPRAIRTSPAPIGVDEARVHPLPQSSHRSRVLVGVSPGWAGSEGADVRTADGQRRHRDAARMCSRRGCGANDRSGNPPSGEARAAGPAVPGMVR